MKYFIFILSFYLISCASTTEQGEIGIERKQLLTVSSEEMMSISLKSYTDVKKQAASKNQLDVNSNQLQRVQNISKKLIPFTAVFRKDALAWPWEVHIITSDEVNAYCMPGGKIIFYTGIIEKLKLTDAEIATVMGHEIAHALREHGRERMSEEYIKQIGLSGLQLILNANDIEADNYLAAANMATTVFVSLKHSRKQESEADEIGLEIMARAGYNPEEAITLWKKMSSISGGKNNLEILSTHPSNENRIENMQGLLNKVMPLYQRTVK